MTDQTPELQPGSPPMAVAIRMSSEFTDVVKAIGLVQAKAKSLKESGKDKFLDRKYPTLQDYQNALRPLWGEAGLTVIQACDLVPGTVRSVARHVKVKKGRDTTYREVTQIVATYSMTTLVVLGDQWVVTETSADTEDNTDAQAVGSVQTYLGRYAHRSLWQLTGSADDDDGYGAGRTRTGEDRPPASTGPRPSTGPGPSKPRRETRPVNETDDKGQADQGNKEQADRQRFLGRRAKLSKAVMNFCEGDKAAASQVLLDISSDESFEGFKSVAQIQKDYQVEAMAKRFVELTGQSLRLDL